MHDHKTKSIEENVGERRKAVQAKRKHVSRKLVNQDVKLRGVRKLGDECL